MAFDVFISYSTKDKATADAACAALESAGIRCWIAPRDVRPGAEYAAAIIEAIDSCHLMVLIFSSNANASRQIHREIERAASKGVPIVPMRIEEITPTKSMEYFLAEIHWLDALTPPLAAHLHKLIETIKAILQVDVTGRAPLADSNNLQQDSVSNSAASVLSRDYRNKSDRTRLKGITVNVAQLGLISIVGILSAAVFLLWQQRFSPLPPIVPDHPASSGPATPPMAVPASPPVSSPASGPGAEFVIRKSDAFGGAGGSAFDDTDENPNHLPISALKVVENLNPGDTTQRIIGGLQVQWGDKFGPLHAGNGNYAQPAELIKFAKVEKIGRVDVNWMKYKFPTSNNVPPQWIAGLAIWTDSRVYNFGNMTFGPTNQCILTYGEILLGFFGRSGAYIDQIGCIIGKGK
jgi:TIR domain-containing protein/jacalin-like lectin domain-containing protein